MELPPPPSLVAASRRQAAPPPSRLANILAVAKRAAAFRATAASAAAAAAEVHGAEADGTSQTNEASSINFRPLVASSAAPSDAPSVEPSDAPSDAPAAIRASERHLRPGERQALTQAAIQAAMGVRMRQDLHPSQGFSSSHPAVPNACGMPAAARLERFREAERREQAGREANHVEDASPSKYPSSASKKHSTNSLAAAGGDECSRSALALALLSLPFTARPQPSPHASQPLHASP